MRRLTGPASSPRPSRRRPLRRLRLVAPARRRARLAVRPGGVAGLALGRLDPDPAFALLAGGGPPDRLEEPAGDGARHFEHRLAGGDADGADLVLGDVAAPAEEGEQPARIGIVAAANVHSEPDRVLEARARALGPGRR